MAGTSEGGRKTAEGGRGDQNKASPAAIDKYLKGIDFPAEKNDLLSQAKKNSAPEDVINVMENLEEKTYNSPIDVAKAVGQVEG